MSRLDTPPVSPAAPARRSPFGLKARLLAAFCTVAIAPSLGLMLFQFHFTEQGLHRTVDKVTREGQSHIKQSGAQLAGSSVETLSQTSDRLIELGRQGIQDTSQTLVALSQKKLQDASRQIIDRSEKANAEMASDLAALSLESHQALTKNLIGVSDRTSDQLARTTAKVTEQALSQNTRRLTQLNEQMARDLAGKLSLANAQVTKEASRKLLSELEREPLVNFRAIAHLLASAMAGGRSVNQQMAYVTLVNRVGVVVASTKFKRGTAVRQLEIVRRALTDSKETSEEMPIIVYQDGDQRFLGTYAHRQDGGAVIVSYNLNYAEADFNGIRYLIESSMASGTEAAVSTAQKTLAGNLPRLEQEANALSADALRQIGQASQEARRQSARQMAAQATAVGTAFGQDLKAEVAQVSSRTTEHMHADAQTIIRQALEEMTPIGRQHARKAVEAMTPQAERAVAAIEAELTPQIERAAQKAAEDMLPEVAASLSASRQELLHVAIALLGVAVALSLAVSVWLSKSIADPIDVERRLKESELRRMGQEMEIAARIQSALLPTAVSVEGFDLAIDQVPATEVGGDMVDLIPGQDGEFWAAIGDVTGHGLTPGLVMMMAQSIFTALVMEHREATPSQLLVELNQALHQNIRYRLQHDGFMTLQLMRHMGGGRFMIAGLNCDVLLYRAAERRVERLEPQGTWVGLLPSIAELTSDSTFQMDEDDVLVLFTDGLVEAQNDRKVLFDLERVERALLAHADHPAGAIKGAIMGEVQAWLKTQADDISILVLKRERVARHAPTLQPTGLP